jgi:adenylylsulfate kinase
MMHSEVLFLGGRSGVGKSSVAFEVHAQLAALNVKHCVIEGDSLDLAFPHLWEHHLAERNLAVLLTATDETSSARLRGRIQGSDLQEHLDRSDAAARELDLLTPRWVHRRPTDNLSVQDIAADLLPLTGWTANPAG